MLIAAWVAVLGVLAVWSARNDPPTVADQRDIAAAMPEVRRATGALMAAADGPDRAVVLGDTVFQNCSVTAVRDGRQAVRDITVYVPAGRALPVLQSIAGRLPSDYRAGAGATATGRRVGLHADAGVFVGIDAAASVDSQVLTLRVSTGCRPGAGAKPNEAGPAPGPPPAALTAALRALGAAAPANPRTQSVACPDGGVAATWTVPSVAAPKDLGASLQPLVAGASVVRAEPAGWAYRTPAGSVVVLAQGDGGLRVSATSSCA
ncbi:hypothetical protein GCM10012284_15790 [Mangrovihabitans endophyticus]|uniref:Uncharacterized protein n=1 Tax=Mangrovihabitans endophyticus TaxID=1751298 RepID=A0A8J3BYE0_9ACTN|nr:hypothetical protein GCM10012284_15790 [Mangrovihabitans endophyticus]